MGDALDLLVEDLRLAVRSHIGQPAEALPQTCDDITTAVCVAWPVAWATDLARRSADQATGNELIDGLAVVRAKVREVLEAQHDTHRNDSAAIDLLLSPVLTAVAWFWFDSRQTRARVRRAIWHVRHD